MDSLRSGTWVRFLYAAVMVMVPGISLYLCLFISIGDGATFAVSAKESEPGTPAFWAPPPVGFVAQRHPISVVIVLPVALADHAARASGGLPPCRNGCFRGLGSAIAKHAHCAERVKKSECEWRAQWRAWHVRRKCAGAIAVVGALETGVPGTSDEPKGGVRARGDRGYRVLL